MMGSSSFHHTSTWLTEKDIACGYVPKDSAYAGKGAKIGDDGEQVPAYYQQWADKIKDMSPARQADVLDQLGEDDRYSALRELVIGYSGAWY